MSARAQTGPAKLASGPCAAVGRAAPPSPAGTAWAPVDGLPRRLQFTQGQPAPPLTGTFCQGPAGPGPLCRKQGPDDHRPLSVSSGRGRGSSGRAVASGQSLPGWTSAFHLHQSPGLPLPALPAPSQPRRPPSLVPPLLPQGSHQPTSLSPTLLKPRLHPRPGPRLSEQHWLRLASSFLVLYQLPPSHTDPGHSADLL